MKIAMVINGCSTSISEQMEELNSFANKFINKTQTIEVWVLMNKSIFKEDITKQKIRILEQVKKIKFIETQTKYLPEEFLDILKKVSIISNPDLIIFGSGHFGSHLSVRLAIRLNGSSCVGVKNCEVTDNQFLVEKHTYSNNLTAKFYMKKSPYCISISKGFKENVSTQDELPEIEKISLFEEEKINELNNLNKEKYSWIYSSEIHLKKVERGLNTANIVVAVGRGIGSKENLEKFKELANLIGGELGASRPVVLSAWTELDRLIGASGYILAPEICIAIGVSGAAAFTIGIEKSKWILAINKDIDAPIFKMADVAVEGDYKEIVNELINYLKEN